MIFRATVRSGFSCRASYTAAHAALADLADDAVVTDLHRCRGRLSEADQRSGRLAGRDNAAQNAIDPFAQVGQCLLWVGVGENPANLSPYFGIVAASLVQEPVPLFGWGIPESMKEFFNALELFGGHRSSPASSARNQAWAKFQSRSTVACPTLERLGHLGYGQSAQHAQSDDIGLARIHRFKFLQRRIQGGDVRAVVASSRCSPDRDQVARASNHRRASRPFANECGRAAPASCTC